MSKPALHLRREIVFLPALGDGIKLRTTWRLAGRLTDTSQRSSRYRGPAAFNPA